MTSGQRTQPVARARLKRWSRCHQDRSVVSRLGLRVWKARRPIDVERAMARVAHHEIDRLVSTVLTGPSVRYQYATPGIARRRR